jgi:hypothetical protein
METKKSSNIYKKLFIASWAFFILIVAALYIFSALQEERDNNLPTGAEEMVPLDTFEINHPSLVDSIRDLQDLITQQFPAIDSSIRDETVVLAQKKNLLQLSGNLVSCKYLLDDEIDSIRLAIINTLATQINSTLKSTDKNIERLKKIAIRTNSISTYLDGITQALAFLMTRGIIKPKIISTAAK